MKTVIKPTSYVPHKINEVSVFLAGSIEQGKAELWQDKVIEAIDVPVDVAFFNPRRDEWDASWVQSIENTMFREQVEWELHHIKKADICFFYFQTDTLSPISLLELGFRGPTKSIVVCSDGFWRKGNIEVFCKMYNITLVGSLHEGIITLNECVKNHIVDQSF